LTLPRWPRCSACWPSLRYPCSGGDPDGKKMIAAAVIAQVLGNFFINEIIKIKV
jgi:hypothetical protein